MSTDTTVEPTREWLIEFMAKYHGHPSISSPQMDHRFALVNAFGITHGQRVLEIGCGQGDCTAALAVTVGAEGHITAVDPAPADYGSPLTVHQAQDLLSDSELGPRISWKRAVTPVEYLAKNPDERWDVAVLAQCLWYFASPEVIRETFAALKGRVQKVVVAEFSLRASNEAAVPHVLAALTQGALALHDTDNTRNIRTCIGPEGITKLAKEAGLELVDGSEQFLAPDEKYQDGRWEIGEVKSARFGKAIKDLVHDDRARAYIETLRNATLAANAKTTGKSRSMDVWIGIFTA
ncbi:hypothetical protein BKA62DRAFT_180366 [Auriculariales sp. MPI-PUGE-AT-0066]|nr:hypothetical protein BKA62DRAFT_180366 [Auriculariales sp. MPI-PUGE-AT-0066]